MSPSMTRNPRFRWLVVALPAAGALLMLAVMALGWRQTERAADLVLRGEAALLVDRVAREARRGPTPVSSESLQRIVASEARAGLLLVAAQRSDGEVVASSSTPPKGLPTARELRPGDLIRQGNRAWARSRNLPSGGQGPRREPRASPGRPDAPDDRRPPRRDEDQPRPPRDEGEAHPPRDEPDAPEVDPRAPDVSLLILFEPRLVGEIHRSAQATLVAGALGAAGLLLLGFLALRLIRRNEESLQRLEKERRLASLGTMSAVVAHELRNPLAALKGHAQLLVEALEPQPRERAHAQRVVDGAWRLERLSTSLLELARTGELARRRSSPAAIVAAAVEALDGSRIRIDASRAPEAWSLDPDRFQHVVANLVDNALQAAPGQAVDLLVAAEGGRLVVEVRDRGPGIPGDDRDRIFEPFVTTRAKGVGLGLAVARQVVALHGGTLTVSDAPGGGALFRVEVPA
jgi:two-component system sensor histidine kinase HydH